MAIISSWQSVLAFYLAVAAFVYYHKDKLEFQGKIVALYKTDVGIDAMKALVHTRDDGTVNTGETLLSYTFYPVLAVGALLAVDQFLPGIVVPVSTQAIGIIATALFLLYTAILAAYRPIERAGYHGIIVGYAGMLVIMAFLVKGIRDFFVRPDAPPVIAPIVPGVDIPGSPITIPLVSGLLSLFFVIVIHEFSHGVVSKSHGVPIESSGLLIFGPIPGAFVEPNEEQLEDESGSVQNAVFAAGPYSNVLTGLLALILVALVIQPGVQSYLDPQGYTVTNIKNGTPAENSEIRENITYTGFDDTSVRSAQEFVSEVRDIGPNETLTFKGGGVSHTVTTGQHPRNASRGYIGVDLGNAYVNDGTILAAVLQWLLRFFNLFVMLSFGLGLANLLPLGPVDGGRLYRNASVHFFGEERGESVWAKTTVIVLSIIVLLLLNSIVLEGILGL